MNTGILLRLLHTINLLYSEFLPDMIRAYPLNCLCENCSYSDSLYPSKQTLAMNFLNSVMNFDNFTNVMVSTILINFSFFVCCYWIYRNETEGRWEQYRIRIMDAVKGPQH